MGTPSGPRAIPERLIGQQCDDRPAPPEPGRSPARPTTTVLVSRLLLATRRARTDYPDCERLAWRSVMVAAVTSPAGTSAQSLTGLRAGHRQRRSSRRWTAGQPNLQLCVEVEGPAISMLKRDAPLDGTSGVPAEGNRYPLGRPCRVYRFESRPYVPGPMTQSLTAVSKSDVPWLIPLFLCLALLALVTGVFVASVTNARRLRRDLDERFGAVQARLEKQANAIADELLAPQKGNTDQ